MHRPILAAATLALGCLFGPAAGFAAAEPKAKLVRSVERLADAQSQKPVAGGDVVCRWATQTMTYQGVSHTRRVKVCQKRSWWEELARKAKASTSRSRPRPG